MRVTPPKLLAAAEAVSTPFQATCTTSLICGSNHYNAISRQCKASNPTAVSLFPVYAHTVDFWANAAVLSVTMHVTIAVDETREYRQ
jgi:hypothetical protein